MRQIKIKKKVVGHNRPCFIIAEAGVNHNGKISLAKKLIDAAAKAGADAIKFQAFKTERLIIKDAPKAAYQKTTTGSKESQFDMLKRLELDEKQNKDLITYANKRKIIFISTPYDTFSVDLLDKLRVPAYKVASCDLTNIPLLESIVRKDKPIFLSTGMGTLKEVDEAVSCIGKYHKKIVLLHCTTEYPTKIDDVNLKVMMPMEEKFNLPVGYSDHTKGFLASIAAVSLGACVIEKHFTLDKNLPGPDHKASVTPAELSKLVKAIRDVETLLGSEKKVPTTIEMKNKLAMRRGLYSSRDIRKGETITKDMISIKRPEKGLRPKYLKLIIGKRAKKDIAKDQPFKSSSLEEIL